MLYLATSLLLLSVNSHTAFEEPSIKLVGGDDEPAEGLNWLNPHVMDHMRAIRNGFHEGGIVTLDNFLLDSQIDELKWFFAERMQEVQIHQCHS